MTLSSHHVGWDSSAHRRPKNGARSKNNQFSQINHIFENFPRFYENRKNFSFFYLTRFQPNSLLKFWQQNISRTAWQIITLILCFISFIVKIIMSKKFRCVGCHLFRRFDCALLCKKFSFIYDKEIKNDREWGRIKYWKIFRVENRHYLNAASPTSRTIDHWKVRFLLKSFWKKFSTYKQLILQWNRTNRASTICLFKCMLC